MYFKRREQIPQIKNHLLSETVKIIACFKQTNQPNRKQSLGDAWREGGRGWAKQTKGIKMYKLPVRIIIIVCFKKAHL